MPPVPRTGTPIVTEDKRGTELKVGGLDSKLATLKAYRKARGLCFTCGERWGRDHKCATAVQLHVVQELLDVLEAGEPVIEQEEVSLMAISKQAAAGTESSRTIRLRGWVQGAEVLMLVDSGSSHSFIDKQLGLSLLGVKQMKGTTRVMIADGGVLSCSMEIPDCDWYAQGHSYKTTFKLLSLGNYDVILGMDWLELHSPMQIDWVHKWIEFPYCTRPVRIQGIVPQLQQCDTISLNQLHGLAKAGSLMYLLQISPVEESVTPVLPEAVQTILQEFQDVFAEPRGLPPKRSCDHHIPLVDGAKPVFVRPYRYNPWQKDEIEKQVKEMLNSGVIQHSSSLFSSPALLVRKKDGTWRLCIDYRHLNAVTKKSKYPMPVIDELLDELSGAKFFSKLDLRAGYHQIRMKVGDEHKTAFQTHTGHYEYRVMSFGLTGAPGTFQAAMNNTLSSVLRKCALVFFDDILIYSPTLESHMEHLNIVLSLLREHQWQVKLSKCAFAQSQISYLGHIISGVGVATDPSKVQDILNWPIPTNLKKLRGFLGIAGYYRKFVKGFGVISKPLTNLLKKGVPYQWTADTEQAFQQLKQSLITAPVLALPDFHKQFVVETDASDVGIGAVLSQASHPIAFVSKLWVPGQEDCLLMRRNILQFYWLLIIGGSTCNSLNFLF